jgi:hypothetical protein
MYIYNQPSHFPLLQKLYSMYISRCADTFNRKEVIMYRIHSDAHIQLPRFHANNNFNLCTTLVTRHALHSDLEPHPTFSLYLRPQSTHQIILDPIVKYHSPNQHIHPNKDQHYHLPYSIWPFFNLVVLFIFIRIASASVGVKLV